MGASGSGNTRGVAGGLSAGLPPGAPPPRIGKYQLVRLIGRGGMAAVHEAVHPELRKRVAIKMLRPEVAEQPEALARFLQEGEAASRIKHPHVVNVLDVGMHEGAPFLVMEYLDGETLSDHFTRRGALGVEELVDLLLPAVAAVAAAHDAGVVHRDLKPQNIFLERGERGGLTAKVLDFGISKMVDGPASKMSLTGATGMLGTLGYISPEQAESSKHVDGRTDQYALGVILYEGITGRRAFDENRGRWVIGDIIAGKVTPLHYLRPDLPPGFEAVIVRAMHPRPDARYPTLRAFGAELLPFASARVRLPFEQAFLEARAKADGGGHRATGAPAAGNLAQTERTGTAGSARFARARLTRAAGGRRWPLRLALWAVAAAAVGGAAAVLTRRGAERRRDDAAPIAP